MSASKPKKEGGSPGAAGTVASRSPFKPKMFACFAPSVPEDWEEEEEGMTTPRKEDDQNKVWRWSLALERLQARELMSFRIR